MTQKNLPNNSRAFIILLEELSDRDKEILKLRFLEKLTLIDVSRMYNLSNQAIREIEDKAIQKIEHTFDFINLI
jgi:RNA polymerase sigma factor (sigma-70 family)